jgi:SAM-dependent methyltransferase
MPDTPPAPGFSDAAQTWNRRFSAQGFLFGTEPNEWLRRHAAELPAAAQVLCVADGEGRNSVFLARQGHRVMAFDVSAVAIEKARGLASREGVSVDFALADADSFAWPQASCDAVVAIFVQFADPAMRERMFAHMVQALKPGGLLILQGYTPKQLDYRTGGPGVLSHLYTEPMLREAFDGLEFLQLEAYEADLSEGSGHHGRSALIGLVARRPA